MWKYVQSTGEMFRPDGTLLKVGYSGAGDAKNDPNKQCERNKGPIPRGYYDVGAELDKPTAVTLPLTPRSNTDVCGRRGFLIHGDNTDGTASTGCIVLNTKSPRVEIRDSNDALVQVVMNSLLSKNNVRKNSKQNKRGTKRGRAK